MTRQWYLSECCGIRHRRWVFGNRRVAVGQCCPDCGAKLRWEKSLGTCAAASMRRYLRMRERNILRGLTAHGTPRKRRAKLTVEERRAYNLARYHRIARARMAAGLTTRGTPRKISRVNLPANPLEIAWRNLRSELDQEAA